MSMWKVLAVVSLVGCGDVAPMTVIERPDASVDAPVDVSTCTEHASVSSCGATCQVCPSVEGRSVATCDGTACGATCLEDGPTCSDGSCSKTRWSFDSGRVDGITVATVTPVVRQHLGTGALALDTNLVTGHQSVQLVIPVCLTGNRDLAAKTLTATLYFDDPTIQSTIAQFFIDSSINDANGGAYLPWREALPNTATPISVPLAAATSADATTVVMELGSYGAQFHGTVWVDDIVIQ